MNEKFFANGRPCKPTGIPLVDLARIRIRPEVLEQWRCDPAPNADRADMAKVIEALHGAMLRAQTGKEAGRDGRGDDSGGAGGDKKQAGDNGQ
jgi:hypothetical protein